MMQFLCNDLVINEDSCNLSCEYCLTGQSNLKSEHVEQLIFQPPQKDAYGAGQPLKERLLQIVERFDALYDPLMIKVTGGEIYLVRGIEEFIDYCAERYETVIIQTNGIPVTDRQLDQLEALPNVVIQISLDSHRYDGNSYRVRSESQHDKVIERISRFFTMDVPVEIYAVINDRSIKDMESFAAWLSSFPYPPQLFAFPVRGPDAEKFKWREDQLHHLDAFMAARDHYPEVIPGQAYLDRLSNFFQHGERTFGCHLPRLVASTFSDGVLTPCPNIWFSDAGKLTEDAWRESGAFMTSSGLRRALLEDAPRLDACKKCFTPWDVLSMYMDDLISLDDLCATKAYGQPSLRPFLAEAKIQLQDNG